jgi:hypothetical protein
MYIYVFVCMCVYISVQKSTLLDVYNFLKCNDSIIHININEYMVVDTILETGDMFINAKIVDDFNTLHGNDIY